MDSIGDIVYVIAIVGYIIYSFVSGAKKQKNKRKTVDDTTSRPEAEPDIRKMLEEMFGKTEQEKPKPAPVYTKRKATITPVYTENYETEEGESQEGKAMNSVDNYKFGNYKTSEAVISDDTQVVSEYERFNSTNYKEETTIENTKENQGIKEVVHLVEEKEATPVLKEFDIEKAIIYSEILKRPAWAV